MKVWEYCRDLSTKFYNDLAVVGVRYELKLNWEKFAETGDCNGIPCNVCPFKGKTCTPRQERVVILNREIVVAPDGSIRQRLMTNKELSRWLAEKPNREVKSGNDADARVYHYTSYPLDKEDEEVDDDTYVREGDSPWFVPFKESCDGEQVRS